MSVILRFAAYSVALFGLLLVQPVIIAANRKTAFDEEGAVEWIQWGIIAAATILLGVGAICFRACRPLLTCLCCVAAVATVREQDALLSQWVPSLEWPGVAACIVLSGFLLLWRRRADFARQTAEFTSTTAFGFLWIGFLAVVGFAQLVGDHRIWQTLLPAELERGTRRAIQELCESFGYYLLLIGAAESLLYARAVSRKLPADRPVTRLATKTATPQRIAA